ncbi:MAG TPA: glycosyltransferase [Nostoc sp.]|uniref:O-linked N-acetylglucosamine transferase family protein n=1 Tax=Nostoc sp. TaxID=1180 RepID=UPI002D604364|nr:glycosyltransferase [Nostoc sp.]HYX12799.1 glycosyltransferase [Nostoc sp.]
MLINRYVNIGIVTFNRLEFTKEAIASVVKYTCFPHTITVVDNASHDGTKEYLKELHQTGIINNLILLEDNIGIAKASNLAWLQEPEALYYLKYDNDIVIQKNNWLSTLVSVVDAIPEIGVIGYNFEPISYPLQIIRNHQIRVKEEGNIGGACFLIPKRTQDILGYWCEDYGLYGFEDVDYSFRVKLAGLLNVYMADEEIGIHLPAGKAPRVDGITWCASDGVEEVTHKEYRNFKDLNLRENITNGLVNRNFEGYINRKQPLYIFANSSLLPMISNRSIKINEPLKNNLIQHRYQSQSKNLRVDLGSGTNKPDGFIGVDIWPGLGIDIVADLSKNFPFEDNSVDEVRAHDVIEHLQDRLHTMNEIWRICKPGAKVDIRVPSTDGRGAFQDPTHISFWNINSFLYYCNDFPSYLELCKRYGFQGEFKAIQLENEETSGGVIHVRAELCVVKPTSNLNEKPISENVEVVHHPQAVQKQLTTENNVNSLGIEIELLSKLFLFPPQIYFREIGEADNYYEYLQNSLNYLHASIFSNSDSKLWHQVAHKFTQTANFIPAYFNESNLKDIYVKRAEIIEYFLKLNGHELDYEFADRPVNRKKIRLGILATHFTPSAETFAYLPVYEYISRDFEVILYSLSQTGHRLEQYCQLCANSFKLLPQELSAQVKTIRADDVDILFIATNVTAVTNQICLLGTHRLARIQVTSGGSVVTTGMRNMDYYISGTLTDPSPAAQNHYQEKLVKLEGSAHCFSYGTEEEKLTTRFERDSLKIPEDAVVFISGANYFKTVPELIETWAKIISRVENSVLVLLPFGPNWLNNYPKTEFINHLNSIFSKYGLGTERLIVLDPQPVPDRDDMKEYYKIADIYLDSYPFAGTTSLVEPLQVNLPVIARQGNSFRSAMGAAMVQALDVPDLVADSEESYIQLAIALGTDPELRQQKSAQIKERMQDNPSFLDSRSYSAKIGNLFQELFSKYIADTLSQNFRLGDINLIIFPDWSQSEDLLYQDLASAISTLTTHPEKSNITLLIDTHNISEEEADMLLSSLTMNLLMEDDVDITEGPEISLLGKMTDAQWKTLLPRINTRIALATDNQSAIAQAKAGTLSSCDVDSLIASNLEITPAF